MRHTSSTHALDIARLSPAIAARRAHKLVSSGPIPAAVSLSNLVMEKSFVLSAAWMGGALALANMQWRWLTGLASGARVWSFSEMSGEGETIARKTLAPIAKRVRRNSRRR